MKTVIREVAVLREIGEDVSQLIELARMVCYKNLERKEHPDYINKDDKNEEERVS